MKDATYKKCVRLCDAKLTTFKSKTYWRTEVDTFQDARVQTDACMDARDPSKHDIKKTTFYFDPGRYHMG